MAALPRKPEVVRTLTLDPALGGGDQARTSTWEGPIEALFGYTLIEVDDTEEWWHSRIHPEDRDGVVESLEQHLLPEEGTPFAAEARIWGRDYRFRNVDGYYVLVSDRSITTRDDDGNVLSLRSVIFDKDLRRLERKKHAEFLASQNHLAIIADNTPSGIFMMDPQGYTTYMNTAAEQITGFSWEEIYDYTFHASVHSCRRNGDNYPLHECPVFGAQQAGLALKNQPETFVHKDGHHYDIVWSVSPVGNYATGGSVIEFRDVTEEKNIEIERMSALLMTEQQSVRLKESEIHKENMTSFVSFVCHELRNPLQGVTSSAEFLLDTLQKLEAVTSTLSNSGQKPEAVNALADQISSAIISNGTSSAEDLGRDSEDALVQLQRETSIAGRGSSTMVVSPTITAMEGLITYAKQLVTNIQTCAEHQALITNNVLDLSRLDAGKVEPLFDVVDVQALAAQTVSMMSARAQVKSINLSVVRAGRAPLYLRADTTMLSQVLLNLVSNAIKFTPEHGSIIIDLTADSPDQSQKVKLHGSVTDNGLGMTEEEQQRLFQRFSQANRRVAQLYGGSGLGLSITKELVRVMGGDMQVESQSGKGSTFSFTTLHEVPNKDEILHFIRQSNANRDGLVLEVLDTRRGSSASAIEVATEPPPKFSFIGVAEDNPINLKHLSKHLQVLGYQHCLCTNGKELLDKFCEADSPIDAMIIDMSMPVMDGLEATRLMRAFEVLSEKRHTPIIALSGNALSEQINDAWDAGVSDYLTKPCKQADLARSLSYWEKIVHTGADHRPMLDKWRARP